MLTFISAHSPAYSTEDHSSVTLFVQFLEFEDELPFTATQHDPMTYGVEIFNKAINGEFGPITDFVVAHPGSVATQAQPTTIGAQTL